MVRKAVPTGVHFLLSLPLKKMKGPEGFLQAIWPWSSPPSFSLTFPSLSSGRWRPALQRIHEVIGCGAMALFGPRRWLSFAQCNLSSCLTLQIITAPLKTLGPGSGLGHGDGGGDTALGQWDAHRNDGRLPVEEDKLGITRIRRRAAGCKGRV